MRTFAYDRPSSEAAAIRAASALAQLPLVQGRAPVEYLAGGTTLVDLMKLDVMRPVRVVDLGAITGAHDAISVSSEGVRLGAMVKMAAAADHPEIVKTYPVIAQSLQQGASAQLRNMATLGGNVLQRTRCPYFRDTSWTACNKRDPGSGCTAMDGLNRQHALLGGSRDCIATYPGDFAQSLIALDATVSLTGLSGDRTIPFATLHRLPGATPSVLWSEGLRGCDLARDHRVILGSADAQGDIEPVLSDFESGVGKRQMHFERRMERREFGQ
jgi:xanthine dehydrogenase YagS FAD-binding subunit